MYKALYTNFGNKSILICLDKIVMFKYNTSQYTGIEY